MDAIDLTSWDRFVVKYVNPVFSSGTALEDYYEFLQKMKPNFYPKSWVAVKFYNRIKEDERFDDELKRFFAFLYSCGFFMEHIITFEEWLNMSNWENPNSADQHSQTILEILWKENGVAYLKSTLRWLPFLNQR